VGAVGNTFKSNRGLKEEGTCGEVVVVSVEFRVADKAIAGLILELDDDVVGELVLWVVMMLVPILLLVLVKMGVVVVVGRSQE
jgi:hypothetical protein